MKPASETSDVVYQFSLLTELMVLSGRGIDPFFLITELTIFFIHRIDDSLGLAGSLNDQLDASRDAIGILRDVDGVCAAAEEEVCMEASLYFVNISSCLLSVDASPPVISDQSHS